MDAKTLDIARRFAACPKWSWLRGMSVRSGDHPCERWLFDGEAWVSDEGDTYRLPDLCAPASLILAVANGPDLDDEVTRAGLLPVVRRAWNDETASVRFIDRHPLDSMWEYRGRWVCYGRTEIAALCRALEAAPHG